MIESSDMAPGAIGRWEQAASGQYFVSCQLLSEHQLWFM